MVPGGWSIAVEMTFYLIVPFVHARLKGPQQALAATGILYLAGFAASEGTLRVLDARVPEEIAGMNEAFVHYWLPYQLYRFFAGFTLYFFIRDRLEAPRDPTQAARDVRMSLTLLIGSAGALGLAMVPGMPKFLSAPVCTAALVTFCCSLAISPLPFLVNAATRAVGKLSFSAYLTHFAALWSVERLFAARGLMSGAHHWATIAPAFAVTSLALTMTVSALTFRWIEAPGQSLGRRLIARLDSVGSTPGRQGVPDL